MRTRLAPTPSGQLHVGNAFSFLLAWCWARTRGGSVVLRIEDTDTTRSRDAWIEDVFRDLEWLGLDWDEGPASPADRGSPFMQSSPERRERHRDVLEGWIARGIAYPCRCTRRELSIDAPQIVHLGDSDLPLNPYPGRCRARAASEALPADSWRLRLPDTSSRVDDLLRGPSVLDRLSDLGDPVLRRADGCFSYHLAVCVDDADQGIDTVVRGRDLAPWSHLHAHLHGLLGHPVPNFAHHALLGGEQGERLAKRIGSTSLKGLREAGVPGAALVGRIAPFLHPSKDHDGTPLSASGLLHLGPPRPVTTDSVITLPEKQ